jgi:hypothetical protein
MLRYVQWCRNVQLDAGIELLSYTRTWYRNAQFGAEEGCLSYV